MAKSVFGEPKFSAAYQLNKEEITRVFNHAYSGAGTLRLVIQSVLLAVVGSFCLYDYLTAAVKNGLSLFVAIAAVVIGVGQWLVMPLFRRSAVKQQVEEVPTIHLSLYDEQIGFGEGERELVFHYDSCSLLATEELLILGVNREFVGIPTRVIGEDHRLFLIEKIPPAGKG